MVSENDGLCGQIVDYLEGEEFDPVHQVPTPDEARRRLGLDGSDADADWDLLVVDLTGRDAGLLNLVESCRSEPLTHSVAVLAITRRADPDTVQSLLASGCTDFLETPLNGTVLQHHARLVRRLSLLEARHGSTGERVRELEEALEEARAEISRLANLDELTEIPTHEQFQKALRREWARLRRSESPLTVALVDIDDYEDYRRQYGLEQAEDQLVGVAGLLDDQLKRPGDLAARFSTAHFGVLLPETDRPGARTVGQNILEAVRSRKVDHEQRPGGTLTVSVGIAVMVPDGEKDRGQLTMLADDALNQARSEGGNRLVMRP